MKKAKGIPYTLEEAKAYFNGKPVADVYAVELAKFLISEIEKLKAEKTTNPLHFADRASGGMP